MSLHLIETLEAELKELAQEAAKDASVVVQFSAGGWGRIKAALRKARAEWDEKNTPAPAPAAEAAEPDGGTPSTEGGDHVA